MYQKTFSEFIAEARVRASQRASKSGRVSKPGIKSGKVNTPKEIKMIGGPGSGKSFMAQAIASKTGGTSFGYDDARQHIHGDHTNQGDFPKVHAHTMNTLRNARTDKPRILDNTNVNPKFRQSTDDKLSSEAGFRGTPVSVMPRTDRRAAFRRNRARGKVQVPHHIMTAMWNQHDQLRKSKEGREAMAQGDQISKNLRISTKKRRFRRRTTKG